MYTNNNEVSLDYDCIEAIRNLKQAVEFIQTAIDELDKATTAEAIEEAAAAFETEADGYLKLASKYVNRMWETAIGHEKGEL